MIYLLAGLLVNLSAVTETPPAAEPPAGRVGVTFYVSKLGDDSDGSSWAKAYRTVQAALDAVPDAQGGHRIVIRPDRYMEANLHPRFKGAPTAYNTFEVDFDGSRGSGAAGYAVLDAGDPEKGFKSLDWWSNFRESPEFSGVDWDRWVLRHLYATGSDAGLFWDLPNKIEPFTVVVEDSIGVGRAFGGGLGNVLPRPDEPVVFRRCNLWSLDWWGDTAGAYVRFENTAMQDRPDITFEGCTLVGPQCSLKSGNPGFSTFTHVKLKECRLITLNFSQPGGEPTPGIIQSVIDGKFLSVDFEDCTLMGYKVFGVREKKETEKDIAYTTQGAVQAYIQFQQDIPKGIHRLGFWPVETFQAIVPPAPETAHRIVAPAPARDEQARKTIYVSKLGDNSDGSSWDKAFTTIQAALSTIPDADGGYRVVIRPDRYMEAMLRSPHPGAAGAYNTLEGDFDGKLGSGTTGYVILDSGDPKLGCKSVDWWGPFYCTAKESAKDWDRWNFRRLYSTGSEGGMGWDLTADKGIEFSVVVEDCVGIGRAFGGIVGGFNGRPAEPVIYRRCQLWSLDWWGDTAGMYVRAEHTAMPDQPDVIMEDCTLASPQCALKAGNPGFDGFSRVKLKNCRLITLNFSQPRGTPSPGIIQSVIDGKFLHVDFEDASLLGYKVFGVREKEETFKDIGFTTKGTVSAYVQYEQDVPEGFQRATEWPIELFASMLPQDVLPAHPPLAKEKVVTRDLCEVTPLIWKDRLCLLDNVRPGSGGSPKDYYLRLKDAESGEELARFAEGYGLGCAIVHDNTLYAFASRYADNNWNDVTVFKSSDLKKWETKRVIEQIPTEHLFNSSVCADPKGFTMVYESNDPAYPAFTIKFARSADLMNWEKVPDALIGKDRYTACPCIRYDNGHFYVLYTEQRSPCWRFEIYIARSKDLTEWELSSANPVLTADQIDEGINASDPDLIELDGKTYLYYAVGDQLTWMNIKRAVYPGPLSAFLESWFPKR